VVTGQNDNARKAEAARKTVVAAAPVPTAPVAPAPAETNTVLASAREVTRDFPPPPVRRVPSGTSVGEIFVPEQDLPSVVVDENEADTARYDQLEAAPSVPAQQMMAHGSTNNLVTAPAPPPLMAQQMILPVAPREIRTDPGVPGAPRQVRGSTAPPLATRKSGPIITPRLQALQNALGDMEIEDEFDIPAFLRRHNPPPQ
jgi:hypothetical protein